MSDGFAPLAAIVDGEVRSDGRIPVLALGAAFQHGEGLFETLPLRDGAPRFLDRHLARLAQGAAMLALGPPPAAEIWIADLELLCRAVGERSLAARLLLFRDGAVVRRCVAADRLPPHAEPAAVGVVHPSLDGGRALAGYKTLNYLVPRLAHRWGVAQGFDEVLFSDRDGTVLEGTRSSFFVVVQGVVVTAPLSRPILPGVTREVLLEVGREAGMEIHERAFTLLEAHGADEAFLSSSLRGVRPVKRLLDHPFGPVPGPVTRTLAGLYGRRFDAS